MGPNILGTYGMMKLPKGPTPNKYRPSGPNKNVRGCAIKNPKIAQHVQQQHDKWFNVKFGSAV